MIWISLVLVASVAAALLCALLLTRAHPRTARRADVEPMKKALERRLREGAEFPL